jgi:putative membrane protein
MSFISSKACDYLLWALIAVYAFVTVAADGLPKTFGSPINVPLAILVPLCFAIIHGAKRYGAIDILVFLVLCLGISNVMENLGVMTGFPFGPYHYTDVLGPKLFLVPLLIGPAYFGTGYVSWVLANVLLETDRRRDPLATFVVPVVATFIMVGWDVCLDPGSSTVAKLWIWEKGGGYFGVPLTNFLGWYLTVFLFLQTFALYRAYRPEPLVAPPLRSYWLQASVFFAVMAMDFPALHYATQSVAVTDATGKIWQTGDIFETSAIVSLFTMWPIAVASFAVLLLRREPKTSPPAFVRSTVR